MKVLVDEFSPDYDLIKLDVYYTIEEVKAKAENDGVYKQIAH